MKTTIKILTMTAVLAFSGSSCNEDLLDVEPVNEFLSENYYVSDEQVFGGLVAAYDPLAWSMAYGQWISTVMYGEIRSDNANAGGDPSDNDQPGWQEIDDLRETNTNTVLHPLYRRNYIGIFRSNLVINNVDLQSPDVTRFKAEAKFLRAYYHFELFKHFGPIPVVLTPLTPDDTNLERNTMDEVFNAIVSDLDDAVAVLPATLSDQEAGRASKGAAQALLGKVYLYWADMDNDDQAKFDLAAQNLQAVVDLGQYQLVDDYAGLWQYNVKNTTEAVFEIQHTNLWPSDWGWFEGIGGNGIVQLCGIRGLCSDHPDYEAGWGFMMPTEELYDSYLGDDTYRRRATVVSVADLTQDLVDAGINSCNTTVDITQNNSTDYTGYFQIKFSNWKNYSGNNVNGGDPNLTKDANTYAIRYADVLLMLAEALERGTGSSVDAMNYVDIVRERAFGPGDNTGLFRTAQDIMTDEGWTLLEVIRYERRVELAMEGDRWYDLVRSGRVSIDLFANDTRPNSTQDNFDQNDLWLPISLEETSVVKNLTTYPDPSLFN